MKQDRKIRPGNFAESFGNIANLRNSGYFTVFLIFFLFTTSSQVPAQSQPTSRTIIDTDIKPKPPLIFPLSPYSKFEISDNDILDTIRTFKTDDPAKFIKRFQKGLEKPIADEKVKRKVSEDIYKSIESTAVRAVNQLTFEQLLARRQTKLSVSERVFYKRELKNRPELRAVKILSETDAAVQSLTKTIKPVLSVFGRDNYTEILIYEGEAPFIGLYRECIIIFSTGALELLDEEQKQAAVAHELAHESFVDEMKEADKNEDNHAARIIELKCDLLAVMAMQQLQKESYPFAVVRAAAKFTDWYRKNPPLQILEMEKFPPITARENCIELFLKDQKTK